MKMLILIGVLAVLGVGAFYMSQPTEPAVTNTDESMMETHDATDREHEDDEMDHDDDMSEPEAMTDDDEAAASVGLDLEIDANAKVFDISGTNFAFDVTEIRVQEGDTVVINFESASGFHDWVVDEFDAATEQVRPGTPTSVTFVADKAGTYEYYCSVGSHRAQGMVGTLIVE